MQRSLVTGALVLCSVMLAVPSTRAAPPARGPVERDRCAVKDPSAAEKQDVDSKLAGVSGASAQVVVPVYFHVITSSSGSGDGSGLVPAQLQVLNDAYARAGFAFRLDGVQVVANDAWFFSAQGSAEEQDMKARLRVGGPETLNVYTTLGDVYLGWATFPNSYNRASFYDGVVVYYATLPGGGADFRDTTRTEPDHRFTYDEGDTGTHEVGHWLGLYHTFSGGCAVGGDLVKDTPAEAAPQFYCIARDSCTGPATPGFDPINNFMDYVDDPCMYQFTPEQDDRMQKSWRLFRG
jgi:hypothetical protein